MALSVEGPVDVSVVVVGYGAPELLDRCLASLRGAGRPARSSEVVLVDNASPAPLRSTLSGPLDDLTVFELEHNVGFGVACNFGAQNARGRVVVFVNPDAEVLPGALDALVDFLDADPGRGLVGGRTLDPAGELDPRSCFGDPTLWSEFCFATGLSTAFKGSRLFDRESLGWWGRDSPREVGFVTGCLLAAEKDVFVRLGGFPSDVFMYGEDVLLSRAARRAGLRPSITPDATIIHVGGGTSTSDGKTVMVLRGKATIYRRGAGRLRAAMSSSMLQAGVGLRAALQSVARSSDTRWRAGWRTRRDWRGGWTAADVPPVVVRWSNCLPARA